MENAAPVPAAPVVGARREPSIDPVKAQGILVAVTKKTKDAAGLWKNRWGFYSQIREIQEEEAQKSGMGLEEYRMALQSVSCQPEPKLCPVNVDPSPKPLPPTSAGTVGHRALCPLERYGRLVKTDRDYPIRPQPRKSQIYDPFKQTMVFIGSVDGDPISYKLPPARSEVTDEMWARPLQLEVMPLCKENIQRALHV
ncbi:unnamed protein product [Diatraea saccharalis]|uniref:Uncharacterized protein n=1 Tax=Diatraea saccharalis TaxID=40085 RepID=A0A9N9RD32_9NEOP|nr:unnamed protein product [Diatraea saccharalis]